MAQQRKVRIVSRILKVEDVDNSVLSSSNDITYSKTRGATTSTDPMTRCIERDGRTYPWVRHLLVGYRLQRSRSEIQLAGYVLG